MPVGAPGVRRTVEELARPGPPCAEPKSVEGAAYSVRSVGPVTGAYAEDATVVR